MRMPVFPDNIAVYECGTWTTEADDPKRIKVLEIRPFIAEYFCPYDLSRRNPVTT